LSINLILFATVDIYKEAFSSAIVCWGIVTIDISKEAFSSAIKYGIVNVLK
jgi:hypothetical protein